MAGIGKSSVVPRIWPLSFLQKIFVLFLQLPLIAPALADSFCDQALKRSDSYLAPSYSSSTFRISRQALAKAEAYGISMEELETLVAQSRVDSYERDGKILLPLFRTVRTDEIYRDYVFLAELRRPFLARKKSHVQILSLEKVSEKGQKLVLSDLAEEVGQRPQKLKVRIPGLEEYGFKKGAPVTVKITAPVMLKLLLKHKIDLDLIKMALEQPANRIVRSDRTDDRLEMFYYGDKIMMIVVLGRLEESNTTSLVTSYFTQRIDE